MPPLSYHSSTQGSTHRSSYHSSTQGSTHHSGRHILPPKGIDVLVDTLYFVGSALIPFVTTRSHLSTILSALGSVLARPQPRTSTLTALFLGAHDQLPRGSPILGLLWSKHA
ncbi:hypothetical protein LguiA_021982 [Lonicera macranthoides]